MKTSKIRILVVDDFEPWRRFIGSILSKESKLEIIQQASDGMAAVQSAEELQPDLILLDIGLPSLSGIEAARLIRQLSPDSKILFISEHCSPEIAKEAIRAGGLGYVVKSNAGSDLLTAVVAVLKGRKFASPSLGDHFFSTLDEHWRNDPRTDIAQTPAPRQAELDRCHEVAFYPDDESFVHGLASFAESALRVGKPVVVVANESHRAGIIGRLREHSLDIDEAIKRGLFIQADTVELLSTFMENGIPVAARLEAMTARLIAQAQTASKESSRIAICWELAPTLLAEGKADAAMVVERYSENIVKAHKLDLLCGYVLGKFPPGRQRRMVDRIRAQHSAAHMA